MRYSHQLVNRRKSVHAWVNVPIVIENIWLPGSYGGMWHCFYRIVTEYCNLTRDGNCIQTVSCLILATPKVTIAPAEWSVSAPDSFESRTLSDTIPVQCHIQNKKTGFHKVSLGLYKTVFFSTISSSSYFSSFTPLSSFQLRTDS